MVVGIRNRETFPPYDVLKGILSYVLALLICWCGFVCARVGLLLTRRWWVRVQARSNPQAAVSGGSGVLARQQHNVTIVHRIGISTWYSIATCV